MWRAVLCLAVCLTGLAAATVDADNVWSGFGGDASRRSYKNVSLPQHAVPTLLWNTSGGPFGPVSPMTPVVAPSGVLFIHAPSGVNQCNLLAVNATTGIPIRSVFYWRDLDVPCVTPTLTADFQHIVIELQQFQTMTLMAYRVHADTFDERWTLTLPPGQTVPYGVAVAGQLIESVAAWGGKNRRLYLPLGSQMMKAQPIGGNVTQWSPSVNSFGSDVNETLMINATTGGAFAVSGSSGWSVEVPSVHSAGAVNAYPVSGGSGVVLASTPVPSSNASLFNVSFSAVHSGVNTSSFAWQYHGLVPRAWSVPMASEGVNAFFACNDSLVIVDLPTGAFRGSLPCPGCLNPPLVVWTHVLAMSTDGCAIGFYRWDLSAPAFRACVPGGGEVPVSMAIAGDLLLLTTERNAVFAFKLGN